MSHALGLSSKMTIQTVAGWTTAFPGGTGDTMPFNSEGITEAYEEIQKDALLGYGGREPSEQGNVEVMGSTIHELDYDNFDPLFEMVMGQESSRTFEPTNDHLGKYYWIEFEKTVERWRFGVSKANKLTLKGPEKGGLNILEIEHVCRKLERSGVAMSADVPATTPRVLFEDLVFRIADYVDAIGSGDEVKISSYELTFERNLKTDDYVNDSDGKYKVEPIPGDWRAVALSIELPRYSTATDLFADWKQSKTALQADFVFTSGANTLTIQVPEIRITGGFDMNIEGTTPLKQAGEMKCFRNVANSFMSSADQELWIQFT